MNLKYFTFLMVFTACVDPVSADVITLKNGQHITGEILSDAVDAVRIKTQAGILSFPRAQVVSVSKSSSTDPVIQALFGAIELGNLDAAYTWLESADKVASVESFLPDLYGHWPGLNQLLPVSLSTSGRWENLIRSRVTDASLAGPLLAQIWYRAGDSERAAGSLRDLQRIDSGSNIKVQVVIEELLAAALADNHLGLAARCLELLPARAAAKLSAPDARLIYANQLLDRREWERAATEFLHAKDAAPKLRRAFLVQLLEAPPQPPLSIAAASRLLQVLITAADMLDANAAFLYATKLLPVAKTGQNYDSMLAVVERLAKVDPDRAAILEHSIVFQKQLANLDSLDAKGRYDLAIWARDRELFSEARNLFSELSANELFSQNARLQLELTDTREASSTLQILTRLHETNRHEELRAGVDQFLKKNPPEAFAQHAKDLIQLSEYAKWANEQPNQDQAEGIFQQAQRCVSRAEYDTALAHLNRLTMDYPDSAAAGKAVQLRPGIERMKKRQTKR